MNTLFQSFLIPVNLLSQTNQNIQFACYLEEHGFSQEGPSEKDRTTQDSYDRT